MVRLGRLQVRKEAILFCRSMEGMWRVEGGRGYLTTTVNEREGNLRSDGVMNEGGKGFFTQQRKWPSGRGRGRLVLRDTGEKLHRQTAEGFI